MAAAAIAASFAVVNGQNQACLTSGLLPSHPSASVCGRQQLSTSETLWLRMTYSFQFVQHSSVDALPRSYFSLEQLESRK